jgi:hypothetical protein
MSLQCNNWWIWALVICMTIDRRWALDATYMTINRDVDWLFAQPSADLSSAGSVSGSDAGNNNIITDEGAQ